MEENRKIDYEDVFNILIKNIQDKNEKVTITKSLPIFTFEFFVFHLFLPKEVLKTISNPILSFRILDFPTQNIEGKISRTDDHIIFNKGKSSIFEMDLEVLKTQLKSEPLYIMLIDKNKEEFKVIGTSRIDISIFSYQNFLEYEDLKKKPIARRNILKLFDNNFTSVSEFDMSLLVRREYLDLDFNSNYPRINNNNKNIGLANPLVIDNVCSLNNIDSLKSDKRNEIKEMNYQIKINEKLENDLTKNNKNKIIKQQMPENVCNPSNSANFIDNLKNIIEGKNNPPPLFYHKKKTSFIKNEEIKQIVEIKNEKEIDEEIISKENVEIVDKNRNFIVPPKRAKESGQNKNITKSKTLAKNEDKIKKIDKKISNSSNISKSNIESIRSNQKENGKDWFLESGVNENEYEKLFNKIKNVKILKENETKTFKRENREKNNHDNLTKATCKNELNNERPSYLSPENKINDSQVNMRENSYGKEPFYEVSQLQNFTISQNIISHDLRQTSINEKIKEIVEENQIKTPAKRNDNIEKLKFQTKESSIKPASVIEESKNLIDVSLVAKECISNEKRQIDVEEEYKFDEYMNTINSKEEIIDENLSAKKESSIRKSDVQNNKSSSIKGINI